VFHWDDFLNLAIELASRADDEAALRSAISRSYYAAFHTGREFVLRTGIAVDRSGIAHRQVQEMIAARDDRAGQDLLRLHRLRKQADYDDNLPTGVVQGAAFAVALAAATIERIRALS
jgi:uncharacterized protein (UPF0332 family)